MKTKTSNIRTYATFSLIFSIVSLVYTICVYFGLTRYIEMCVYSPDTYIKKYNKLDSGDKDRVIISITTNKPIIKLKPVINSLLDQTVKVSLITITVPYGDKYDLPDELKDSVLLYRTGKNYGDATCLIPVIMREGEKNTKIITVGDDTVYGKDFIESLLNESKEFPDKVIYMEDGTGLDVKNGAVFKPSFFDSTFVDMPVDMPCKTWVNKYVKDKKGIKYNENFKLI